ncbi:MAG: hypothetical protein IKP86_03470 [Anaerolineaceae bacterium]|nr:hypothetical protein [Anaerolineaceae bacterium]
MFRMLAGTDAAANTGFYVTDLDGDGTPELFFGENYPESSSTIFYDMYTLADGELVHVFDGWDRSRYYLCENGGIAHEGSSSAFESSTGYYYFTNGELKLMQALVYNSRINPEKPWYLSTSSENEPGAGDQPLDESEALYIAASYPYKLVELDPFIK